MPKGAVPTGLGPLRVLSYGAEPAGGATGTVVSGAGVGIELSARAGLAEAAAAVSIRAIAVRIFLARVMPAPVGEGTSGHQGTPATSGTFVRRP